MFIFCRKRGFVLSIILIQCIFLLTGCGFKDIDNRLFVIGIGIDPSEKEEGHYKVTLKLAIPLASIKQEKKPSYQYLIHEGENIEETIRLLESHTDKVLEFGHTKIIVVNEALLENNIKDLMDYFVRRGDMQLIAWVGAAKTSAEAVLRAEPKEEEAVSTSLTRFFDNTGTESPYIVSTFLFEFRRNSNSFGIDPVLPIIGTSEDNSQLIVNKSIIIQEGRAPYELTPRLTREYNTLMNNLGGYSYKVEYEGNNIVINIVKTKVKYKIITNNKKPISINMKIQMTGEIIESDKDLSLNNLTKYNKLAEEEVRKHVFEFLTTIQKENLDPLGFGLRYRTMHLNDKGTMSKWNEAYPELPFDLKVVVDLKSTGTIE
ncbi:Ger(x)C family spore germination protein [Psychrobacillus sp. NPDC096623]|uniref:Ger(x)C family spore germination protein n=1 Tax=Psychrobacillus sp. NPDC096623 TaxID=3364492 RepID=UPI0037FE66C7